MNITKSLLGKVCTIALLFASSLDVASAQILQGVITPKMREAKERPAGMGLRLQQKTVDQFKNALGEFLPHFLTYDIGINKKEEIWDVNMLFGMLKYHIDFFDIRYKEPSLDLKNTKIHFTDMFNRPMLKVKFPGVKHWMIKSKMKTNSWLLPQTTDIVFSIQNLLVDFNTEFQTTEKGFLTPVLYATTLKWGTSKFYHENKLLALLCDQWISFTMIIIQNSMFFLGDFIMNGMLEPPLTQFLNYYQLPLHLDDFFEGQDASADFFLDLRHVTNKVPQIGNGNMDFFFLGELIRNDEHCFDTIVDNNIHFYNVEDQSQFVIGESAATCMVNQFAKSDLGKLNINEQKFNQLFKVDGYKLNTTSLKSHIKIFEEKIGGNKPLKLSAEFKDIKIQFGKYDVDAIVDYTVCFDVKMDVLGSKELLYDCIVMSSAMNIRAENQVMHLDLIEHKINLNTDGANRDAPKRNSMEMTVNEYREFLEDFSFTVSEFKKWLNNVVLRGDRVLFPYSVDEFATTLKFEDQKMHLMIDVEDKAYKYLEEKFWKQGDTEGVVTE